LNLRRQRCIASENSQNFGAGLQIMMHFGMGRIDRANAFAIGVCSATNGNNAVGRAIQR